MFRFGFLALVSPQQTVFISSRFFSCRSLHHCSKNQNPDHLRIRGNRSFVLELEWISGKRQLLQMTMLWSLVSDDQEKRKGVQKLKDNKYPRRVLLYSLSEKKCSGLNFLSMSSTGIIQISDFLSSTTTAKSYQEIRLCSFELWNLGFIGLRWKGHQVVSRVRVSRHR